MDALVAVALGKPTRSRLGKYLGQFRNKVPFRYDERGIRRGYRQRYLQDPSSESRVSLGGSVQATRFYFADDSGKLPEPPKAPAKEAKAPAKEAKAATEKLPPNVVRIANPPSRPTTLKHRVPVRIQPSKLPPVKKGK